MSNALLRLKQMLPLSRQAAIAAAVIPHSQRFRFARAASRLQGRMVRAMGGNGVLTEAAMLEHWLREFTYRGGFSVPLRVHGWDVLEEYLSGGPVLYYTLHLGMSDMPVRWLVERGIGPVPIAESGRMVERDRYPVSGLNVLIPALPAGPNVLRSVRRLLLQGQSVGCVADRHHLDPRLYDNPMRLAARLRVPVIYMWGTLAKDGAVDVMFQPAPHPLCESNEAIERNMDSLRQLRDDMLRTVGIVPARNEMQQVLTSFPVASEEKAAACVSAQ